MTSQRCQEACVGITIAAIEVGIGVALAVMGPFFFGIRYCYYNSYYNNTTCYEDYYLILYVASEGGVCIIAGLILIFGFACRSLCTVRLSLALTSIAALALIGCGVMSFVEGLSIALGIILLVITVWLFISVAIVLRSDGAVVRPVPVARDMILNVGTPSPQPPVVIQPYSQNNFISKVSSSQNVQPPDQPLPSQPPVPQLSTPFYNNDLSPQSPPPPPPYDGQHAPFHASSHPAGPPHFAQNGPPAHSSHGTNAPPLQSFSDAQKPPLPNDTPINGNTNSVPPTFAPHNQPNPQSHGMSSSSAGTSAGTYPPPVSPYNGQLDPRLSSMYSAHPPVHNYPNPQGHVVPPSAGMNVGPYHPSMSPYNGQFNPRHSMYSAHPPAQGMYSNNYGSPGSYPAYPPRY